MKTELFGCDSGAMQVAGAHEAYHGMAAPR